MSERIDYGDHLAHTDPAVHSGENEPSHGHCVNLGKVLKKVAKMCGCFRTHGGVDGQ